MLRAAFAACVFLLASVCASAQETAEAASILLWPYGAPDAHGDQARDRPNLRVNLLPLTPGKPVARPAIVVCPGGGYQGLAIDREGTQIAAWLGSIGVVAAVLDYRHRGKGYGHPTPLGDVQRAVRVVRAHAAEWGIDAAKVGVLGFSAGGHLAASVSVHHDAGKADAEDEVERLSCRPDFAVLCYAVIAFGSDCTHQGSQRNLLGEDAAPELVAKMSCERQVDEHTPPTFLWHTHDDPVVPAKNSLLYYEALLAHGVPAELHVFEHGPHGLGLARGYEAVTWTDLCRRWLERRGVLSR